MVGRFVSPSIPRIHGHAPAGCGLLCPILRPRRPVSNLTSNSSSPGSFPGWRSGENTSYSGEEKEGCARCTCAYMRAPSVLPCCMAFFTFDRCFFSSFWLCERVHTDSCVSRDAPHLLAPVSLVSHLLASTRHLLARELQVDEFILKAWFVSHRVPPSDLSRKAFSAPPQGETDGKSLVGPHFQPPPPLIP